jgi:carbohydrate-selective porin OprB
MKTPTNPASTRRFLRTGLMAAALVGIVAATAAPALADGYRRGDRDDAREHEWREHARFEHRHFAYVAPRFDYGYRGYAAPVYAPPSLRLVFPLQFR